MIEFRRAARRLRIIAFPQDLHQLILAHPDCVVGWSGRRLRWLAETPCLACVSSYMARHQVVSGSLVRANTVPAVTEAWWFRRMHWKTLRLAQRLLASVVGSAGSGFEELRKALALAGPDRVLLK